MTQQDIEGSFDTILGMIAEYEQRYNKPTLDGFTLWLIRKKSQTVQTHREQIKRKVVTEALNQGRIKK